MPRPQKTNVTWFPHPVTHGRKMGLLERKYGNDGYAVWFKLLEELGNAAMHGITLSSPVQIELYAARCLVTEERFLQIISDLIRWEEFDAEIWETRRVLYSPKFVESVELIYSKRQTQKPTRSDILNHFPASIHPAEGLPPSTQQAGGSPDGKMIRRPSGETSQQVETYEDIHRLTPLEAAVAVTGDATDRAKNTWRKYLRLLSAEDPARGERMFRDALTQLYGEIRAGEIRNPAAMLTKRLQEIAL
jgi:hypothetical protein